MAESDGIEALAALLRALGRCTTTPAANPAPVVVKTEDVQRAVEAYLGPLLGQQDPAPETFAGPSEYGSDRPEYYDAQVAAAEARAANAEAQIPETERGVPDGYYDPNIGAEGSATPWMTPRIPPTA